MAGGTGMTRPKLYRASMEFTTEGRTLIGVAVPFEKAAKVRDPGEGAPYHEAFASTAFDVSLRQNPEPRPHYRMHDYVYDPIADPIGVANFTKSSEALLFRAFVLAHARATKRSSLSGMAMSSTSIGFEPIRSRQTVMGADVVTLRTEARLVELSVAPTGRGQYPQSKTLAVRGQRQPPRVLARGVSAAMEKDMAETYATMKRLGY